MTREAQEGWSLMLKDMGISSPKACNQKNMKMPVDLLQSSQQCMKDFHFKLNVNGVSLFP